jgi:hypothetical protein
VSKSIGYFRRTDQLQNLNHIWRMSMTTPPSSLFPATKLSENPG